MTTKAVKTIVSKSSYHDFANQLKGSGILWDVGETPHEYNPFKDDPFINSDYISVIYHRGFLFYDDRGFRELKPNNVFIKEVREMVNEQEKDKA